MISDLASDALPEALNTDVCIIGAGPAGITLALTLARHNVDVVLLESGGETVEPEIQELYHSEVVGRPHIGIHEGRTRAFGGTSTRWGGQILPLFPIDFEDRPWIKLSGWPIGLEELQPYLVRALPFEGLERCLTDDAAVWRTIGLRMPKFGNDLESFLTRWCPEPDFGRLHGAEIKLLPNLMCVMHATVVTLETQEGRISSVLAKTLSGKMLEVRARRVVFCVGAIETPRLLLQQLKDGRAPPWAHSGHNVGNYFQDHPAVTCADILPHKRGTIPQLFDQIYHRRMKYQPRIMLSAARQRSLRSLNAGGTVLAQTEYTDTMNQTKVAGRALLRGGPSRTAIANAASSAIKGAPFLARWFWRSFVKRRAFNPHDLGFRLGVQVEQPPRAESRVSLSSEVDALGMPRARLDWRLGKEEVDAIADFAETVKSAFEKEGIAQVRIDADVASRRTDMLARVVDQDHHMGTARMARSVDTGVVDANLKMFQTENGYVCSSAVFPTSSFSNPTHTLIALAIRLGDHLQSARSP